MATIIVNMLGGERRRYDTAKLDDLGYHTREHGGVSITEVYRTRGKPTRVIVGTYSIWESSRHDGTIIGQSHHEAGEWEVATLADEVDELLALVPTGN